MGKLFGTDGIRGIANETLTCDLAYRVGQATAAPKAVRRQLSWARTPAFPRICWRVRWSPVSVPAAPMRCI